MIEHERFGLGEVMKVEGTEIMRKQPFISKMRVTNNYYCVLPVLK